jgi:hypothetical protein
VWIVYKRKQYLLIQNRLVHRQIQLEADAYRVSIVDLDTLIVCLQDDLARRAVLHRKLYHSNQRQFKFLQVPFQHLWEAVIVDEAELGELSQTDGKSLYGVDDLFLQIEAL